jgi:hypothetical protein
MLANVRRFYHCILIASTSAVILGGCSGAVAPTPTESGGYVDAGAAATLGAPPLRAVANPVVNQLLLARWLAQGPRPAAAPQRALVLNRTAPSLRPAAASDCIFASNNTTGAIDIYAQGAKPGAAPIGQVPAPPNPPGGTAAGFGVVVSPELTVGGAKVVYLAGATPAGKPGFINIYQVSACAPGKITIAYVGWLKPSAGTAVGGAWDQKGNLAVSNTPNATTDLYSAATIQGGPKGAAPTKTLTLTNISDLYFEAAAKAKEKKPVQPDGCCGASTLFDDALIVDGLDSSMNFIVEQINVTTGSETILQTIGNSSSGTGFPGGLAVDHKGNLIVDNQYGYLYIFAPPWTGSATETFSFSYPSNDLVDVALNEKDNVLYASNVWSSGSTILTDVQALSYPKFSFGNATEQMTNEAYVGIAAAPASKF